MNERELPGPYAANASRLEHFRYETLTNSGILDLPPSPYGGDPDDKRWSTKEGRDP